MPQDGLPLATCSCRPARPLASSCAQCLLQTTDVLVPDMQREFLVLRDDYARNKSGEVILSLKRIEVGIQEAISRSGRLFCCAGSRIPECRAGPQLRVRVHLAVNALSLAISACPAQLQADYVLCTDVLATFFAEPRL